MAARQGGGVGPFGWTLLGFLAGVAATLAIQLLMTGRVRTDEPEEATRAAPVVAVTPKLAAPKAKVKPVQSAAAPAPAKSEPTDAQQIAEDAAATGMTTRAQPDTAGSEPPR